MHGKGCHESLRDCGKLRDRLSVCDYIEMVKLREVISIMGKK